MAASSRTSHVCDMTMPHLPQTIPPDLRRKLESVTGYRSFGPQDL